MRLTPTKGTVFLKLTELNLEEKKEFIVTGQKEASYEVIAAGSDVTICAEGQRVFFDLNTASNFQYNGETIYAINESDVLGVENA